MKEKGAKKRLTENLLGVLVIQILAEA
jgi:hypothetical protein